MTNKMPAYLGTWMKNLKDLHSMEYKVGLTLNENTFFQKIVSPELLEKGVRIKPVDYFRGLVFLDYFTNVPQQGDFRICDNIVRVSKALREEERKTTRIGLGSYLTLEGVVLEAGLCTLEAEKDFYSRSFNNIKKRYQAGETVDFKSPRLRKCCLYYEAMGQMVYDLVKDKKKLLGFITSRNQLGALVFSDCIKEVLQDANYKIQVNSALDKGEFLKASLVALAGISKEATEKRINISISKGFKQNG